MQQAIIHLETLACPSCLQKIEGALKRVDGVEKDTIEVMFNSSRARMQFDGEKTSIETIETAIENLGYPVLRSRVKAV